MNPLEKMIQLVRRDPAITVSELASSLGYSEEKSVYYWLDKAGYSGIREFKRDVLGEAREAELEPGPLGTPDSKPGANPFAYTIPTSEYAPLFFQNDVLIVDPAAELHNGDYVLVSQVQSPYIMRYHRIDDRQFLVAVHDPRIILDPTTNATILGRISKLIRTF
ncbi:MAG TPA: S24 family peptidase [Firmicutes bacterium]|nr:S24 family peptidase [Bacillota bacterium]